MVMIAAIIHVIMAGRIAKCKFEPVTPIWIDVHDVFAYKLLSDIIMDAVANQQSHFVDLPIADPRSTFMSTLWWLL